MRTGKKTVLVIWVLLVLIVFSIASGWMWLANIRAKEAYLNLRIKRISSAQSSNAVIEFAIYHGKEAIPGLLMILHNKDSVTPAAAAQALAELGAKEAIPEITALLHEGRTGYRGSFAHALGELGAGSPDDPEVKKAIPELINLFQNEDWAERLEAAKALRKIGDKAVIPELVKLLNDPNWNVFPEVTDILVSFDAKEPLIMELRKILATGEDYKKLFALGCLVDFEDKESIPDIKKMMHNETDEDMLEHIQEALKKLGVEVEENR